MRNIDKKYLHMGITFVISICICILFYFLLFNGDQFVLFGKRIIRMFRPFIYGFFIAYVLNPVMMFIETKIVYPIYKKLHNPRKEEKKAISRSISMFFSLILFLLLLYALIIMVVPQVIESIQSIIFKFPDYFNTVNIWFNNLIKDNKDLTEVLLPYTKNLENYFLDSFLPNAQDMVTKYSTSIIGGVKSTISFLLNLILGIIISMFLLSNKELYSAQAKKIIYALLREERANNLINNIRFSNKTFGGFLNGKLIDSLIIGLLCFITISLFNIPYAVLISVIVGITNIIPYFGPFLGAIPSVILILMIDPMKALTFAIIILVIQQVDGNIIGPKILGDSTGLSSLWVIFAITLFGGLFGVFGMFVGVPVFAVIYAAIKTFVGERLRKKQLPVSTTFYLTSDYHSDEDAKKNTGKEIKFVKKVFENIYVEGKVKQVKVTIEPEETASTETKIVKELDPVKDADKISLAEKSGKSVIID